MLYDLFSELEQMDLGKDDDNSNESFMDSFDMDNLPFEDEDDDV